MNAIKAVHNSHGIMNRAARSFFATCALFAGIHLGISSTVSAGDIDAAGGLPDSWIDPYDINGERASQERVTFAYPMIRIYDDISGRVWSAVFSKDGSHILASGRDSTTKLWVTATGEEVFTVSSQFDAVFSPDGSTILTGSRSTKPSLWGAQTGEYIRSYDGQTNDIIGVAFSPDGTKIAAGGHSNFVTTWDLATGQLLQTFTGHTWYNYTVTFSPDGTRLLTSSIDRTAKIWDAQSGQVIRSIAHPGGVYSALYSRDGTRILTSCEDDTAKLWDASSGELIRSYSGHRGNVYAAVFSPDEQYILTGSQDDTLKLWSAETGEMLKTLSGHNDIILSVEFSPDGTRALSAAFDGTVILWDLELQHIPTESENLITHFYVEALNREPEFGAVDAWRIGYFDFMVNNKIDVRFVGQEMGRQFFFSEEYEAMATTDEEFIRDLYRSFLYRDPNPGELAAWLGGDWNRPQVMTAFSESEEFALNMAEVFPDREGDAARNLATVLYIGLLDRLPGAPLDWADAFNTASDRRAMAKDMARDLLASEEYNNKLPTNRDHVIHLYRGFLGRFPGDSEIDYWAGELDAGRQTLDSLIDAFGDSDEFTLILEEYFG